VLEIYKVFSYTLTYFLCTLRILKMMHTISSHSHENRMNPNAVAACMAPLLLRPLLAGECDLEDDFDGGEDNSAQLLAAANAANNAQAIITVLLEDYGSIFDVRRTLIVSFNLHQWCMSYMLICNFRKKIFKDVLYQLNHILEIVGLMIQVMMTTT